LGNYRTVCHQRQTIERPQTWEKKGERAGGRKKKKGKKKSLTSILRGTCRWQLGAGRRKRERIKKFNGIRKKDRVSNQRRAGSRKSAKKTPEKNSEDAWSDVWESSGVLTTETPRRPELSEWGKFSGTFKQETENTHGGKDQRDGHVNGG